MGPKQQVCHRPRGHPLRGACGGQLYPRPKIAGSQAGHKKFPAVPVVASCGVPAWLGNLPKIAASWMGEKKCPDVVLPHAVPACGACFEDGCPPKDANHGLGESDDPRWPALTACGSMWGMAFPQKS